MLNGTPITEIYADLTGLSKGEITQLNLTLATQLKENTGVAFQGPVKVGAFDIAGNVAREWLRLPNPHGEPNSNVLRPWANGQDITRRPSDTWIIDFGTGRSEKEAALYEKPFAHVLQEVKPAREAQRDKGRKTKWWLHGRTGEDVRQGLARVSRYIATSRVSKHRFFVWLPVAVWPDSRLYAIARDDDATFGVLHSRIHEVWSLANASMHGVGNDPTYNAKSCFETFPFPEGATPDLLPSPGGRGHYYTNPHAGEIAACAKRLNELRENCLNPLEWVERVPEVVVGYPDRIVPRPEYAKAIKERTLTNLYNKRAKGEVQWLEDAHHALDATVARAYGWDDYTPAMPDEEILRRLLALNLQRAGKSAEKS